MRIVIDLPPDQAARVRAALGGEEGARRLLLRLLGSVLDASAPLAPAPYAIDARPEVPAAMSLAGDPIRGDVVGALVAELPEGESPG